LNRLGLDVVGIQLDGFGIAVRGDGTFIPAEQLVFGINTFEIGVWFTLFCGDGKDHSLAADPQGGHHLVMLADDLFFFTHPRNHP